MGDGSPFLMKLLRELWNLVLRSHASLGGHPHVCDLFSFSHYTP